MKSGKKRSISGDNEIFNTADLFQCDLLTEHSVITLEDVINYELSPISKYWRDGSFEK